MNFVVESAAKVTSL